MDPKPKLLPVGVLLWTACLGGLAGGLVLAALAFHLEHTEIAKGLFLGAILSPIHLLGLNRMTARVLNAGEAKGPGLFRVYYLLRWGSFLLVLGILLAISVECLLGALVSYTWFLLVLAWAGVRGSMREKKTPLSGL